MMQKMKKMQKKPKKLNFIIIFVSSSGCFLRYYIVRSAMILLLYSFVSMNCVCVCVLFYVCIEQWPVHKTAT